MSKHYRRPRCADSPLELQWGGDMKGMDMKDMSPSRTSEDDKAQKHVAKAPSKASMPMRAQSPSTMSQ